MKLKLATLLLFVMTIASHAQESFNLELKQQLDSLYYKDQKPRAVYMGDITGKEKTEVLQVLGCTVEEYDAQTWSIIAKQDSLNLLEAEEIIKVHGYPGKSMVGEPANKAIWYVIQHSKKIEQYFPIIAQAGEEGELSMRLVGMMQDRMLMDQNKEQIYGTQVAGRKLGDSDEWFYFVWPIKDAKNVNQRRKEVGFDTSVEENAKRLDVNYQVYTLKQIDSILTQK